MLFTLLQQNKLISNLLGWAAILAAEQPLNTVIDALFLFLFFLCVAANLTFIGGLLTHRLETQNLGSF